MWKLLLTLLLAAGIALAGAFWFTQHWFVSGKSLLASKSSAMIEKAKEPVALEIEPGSGIAVVAARLAGEGRLAHPRLWQLMARLRGEDRLLQAGEYLLPPGQTPAELLAQLVSGEVRNRSLVIVEGATVATLLAQLAEAPKLAQTLVQPDTQSLLSLLDLPEGHAEGRFFPDTYRYRAGDSDRDILDQAHKRMSEHLANAWATRATDVPYENAYELLVMASIIEKETGAEADRAQISQVFARRLRLGMRLQTDPTVIYGLGSDFDGDIRSADLVNDTPYNTYTRRGLPPTPISLPGKAALQAAAHPADGEFLYFVSRGDGSSQFSKTLAEHNAAVRRYQLKRR
ncbi:MAG: endolytic transglycosylase MltG [Pseudomonadales bacterium]